MPPAPFYLDWTFWTAFVAVLALVLSQLPPVLLWFKKAKLDLDVYSKISLTHKVGNPNLQLHLILTNIGGRIVRIKDIEVILKKDGKALETLPAQNFLQNPEDQRTRLFTTFNLAPNYEWAHITNFLNDFDREEEIKIQKIIGKMREEFNDKTKETEPDLHAKIEHEEKLVTDALNFFNSKFIWISGEFSMQVNITTANNTANISKEFRFTMFENHTEQLKEITKRYKLGDGIYWDSKNNQTSVILPILEV